MQNRYIVILTIVTIVIIFSCRLRNIDGQFRKIAINGKIKNILLFPVTIYGQSTIGSIIICISYEVLIVLSMFLMYVFKVDKAMVCCFWGILQVCCAAIAASSESFFEWRKRKGSEKKITYFLLGVLFAIASIIFFLMQMYDLIEVL